MTFLQKGASPEVTSSEAASLREVTSPLVSETKTWLEVGPPTEVLTELHRIACDAHPPGLKRQKLFQRLWKEYFTSNEVDDSHLSRTTTGNESLVRTNSVVESN
jgi:hypothetical protein